MPHRYSLSARWVPGTSNRLTITTPDQQQVVSLEHFEQVCGKKAIHDLYLTGRASLELSRQKFEQLVV